MKSIVAFLIIFFINLNSNKLEDYSEKNSTILVEYIENNNCNKCANWYLVTKNYREFDVKDSEKIYLMNKKKDIINELDYLSENQRPLTIVLEGDFSQNKLNNHRVFEYTSYKIVEL